MDVSVTNETEEKFSQNIQLERGDEKDCNLSTILSKQTSEDREVADLLNTSPILCASESGESVCKGEEEEEEEEEPPTNRFKLINRDGTIYESYLR